MHELILSVMLVSATLYALFGGADFGAGLIEPFVPASERERIDVAIAPVWEANHVWLVLLATLSFVAYPRLYSVVTGYLHIPLLLVLLGCAAFGSLGILLGGSLRAEITLAVANLVWFVLLLAGGIVVPLGMLPRPLAGVGAVLPSGALAEGLRTALSAGHAPSAVQVLVLVGWTVVASALALRTVKLR